MCLLFGLNLIDLLYLQNQLYRLFRLYLMYLQFDLNRLYLWILKFH